MDQGTMNLRYRVVGMNQDEFSIVVRYYTDVLTEHDLRTDPEDATDPPVRCRTDTNITLYDPAISEDELHLLIMSYANTKWLLLQEQVKLGSAPAMPAAADLVGREFARPVLPNGDIDLSDELT
jgi:hypothetical protein